MENELQIFEAPKAMVARAKEAAVALQGVINSKPKPVNIRGEQYIEYEDWQLLGQFFGVAAQTGDANPVEVNGVRGAKATGKLYNIHTGQILGDIGAEAYCMVDEDKWANSPWYQLSSMAQTRAGAKALRNRFAWVVVLAGYRPTPAEEMPTDDTTVQKQSQQQQMATEAQRKKIFATAKQMWGGTSEEVNATLHDIILKKYQTEHTSDLTKKQASELIEFIESGQGVPVDDDKVD